MFDFSRIFRNKTNDWDALQQNLFVFLMCAVVSLREHRWNLFTVNLRFLKALLNCFNISSNITKMLRWTKCCIGLTELKNDKKRKTYVWWRKIMFDENLIARKLFLQHFQPHPTHQHNFYVGLVYSLFHAAFRSYDVISNVRTLNFEWFNNTKMLCKIIAIKKLYTSYRNGFEQKWGRIWWSKLQDQNGEITKMQQKKLKTAEKEDRGNRKKYTKVKEIEKNKGWGNWER